MTREINVHLLHVRLATSVRLPPTLDVMSMFVNVKGHTGNHIPIDMTVIGKAKIPSQRDASVVHSTRSASDLCHCFLPSHVHHVCNDCVIY